MRNLLREVRRKFHQGVLRDEIAEHNAKVEERRQAKKAAKRSAKLGHKEEHPSGG